MFVPFSDELEFSMLFCFDNDFRLSLIFVISFPSVVIILVKCGIVVVIESLTKHTHRLC